MSADLDALKREHNELWREGAALLEKVTDTAHRIQALRKRIETLEGDDYDDIRLMCFGTFDLGGEDD